jgi:hypothetical protein
MVISNIVTCGRMSVKAWTRWLVLFVLASYAWQLPSEQDIAYGAIEESLKRNVLGSCTWKFMETGSGQVPSLSTSKTSGELVTIVSRPSTKEMVEYHRLTPTLTMANPALSVGNVKCKPFAEVWKANTQNSWQLPPSHPRSNKTVCIEASKIASQSPTAFYGEMKAATDPFYVIRVENAIIHEQGILGLSCGYVQLHEGCETIYKFIGRRWHQKCHSNITSNSKGWDAYFDRRSESEWTSAEISSLSSCLAPKEKVDRPKRVERAFLITAAWDGNYHHFISDGLSRLIRYYDFLQANPDIKIHIRFSEQHARKAHYKEASRITRERLLTYLNISLSRIVFGTIVANEVFLPKSTKCNEPLTHALELR